MSGSHEAGNVGIVEENAQLGATVVNRRTLILGVLGVGVTLFGLDACAPDKPNVAPTDAASTPAGEGTPAVEGLHDPVAQHRAAQIISTFENSTTEIQYGYAENLDDGRGITAGRAGFCSGTGDMLMVVEKYTGANPKNGLAKYLPALRKINKDFEDNDYESVGSVKGLKGLEKAWTKAADTDPEFLKAQDEVVNELYLGPAIKRAEGIGIKTAVGQLIIFDTIIQHGEGDDPDGLPEIIKETVKIAPPKEVTELELLKALLKKRKEHLLHAADPDTRDDWRESVDRVNALNTILDSGNPDLRGELEWKVYGDHFSLPAA